MRVSETVDAEAEHVVGLQGFAKEVAIATAILPETATEGNHASIGEKNKTKNKKNLMAWLYKVAISQDIKCTHLNVVAVHMIAHDCTTSLN